MTRTIEDLLAASMRDEVAGLRPSPDLVARAAQRHRRRARTRLTASAAGTAGVAAAVAIGLTVASPSPGTAGTGSSAASTDGQAARSQARLMAAMTASAHQSYRLHLVNTGTIRGHQMTPTSRHRDLINWYADYTGVYDPATHSGDGVNTFRAPSGTLDDPKGYGKAVGSAQVRIVGDNYYTLNPGDEHWNTRTGTLVQALDLNGARASWAPTDGASADPSVLLAAVQQRGSTTFAGKRGSGAQALDTYHFSYGITDDSSVKPHQLTGTIVVHDQSNLIADITMQTTLTGDSPQGDNEPETFKTVMTFSDYGMPVSVQVPANAVPRPKK